MKLLTHNMLQCHIKGVQNGYPLKIEAEKVEVRGRETSRHNA
jgi:multifunctional methyltransferase subunit TRM112